MNLLNYLVYGKILNFWKIFFQENKSDLLNGFWGDISIEGAIYETYKYASCLEQKLLNLSKLNEKDVDLDSIFRPLHSLSQQSVLNESKARKNWLRLYGLKINDYAYIITGGAIKLT